MARKKKEVEFDHSFDESQIAHVTTTEVSEVLETNYMPYTMSVIISRALPEIDGLKPSHRKLLYTMYKMGLLKGGKTKSANIVGTTMRLNPHGDCLRGDTKIYLASGEIKTIKEIYELGISPEIISVDKDGNIKVAEAHSFRVGQYTDEIYKIHLSDGSIVETTGNHPFLTQGMEWVKAENLNINTMLFSGNKDNSSGRVQIKTHCNNKNQIILLEDVVYNQKYGEKLTGYVGHHNDVNPLNNTTDNIIQLSRSNHAKLHMDYTKGLDLGRESMFNEDGEFREKTLAKNSYLMKSYNKVQGVRKVLRAINYLKDNNKEISEKAYEEIRNTVFYRYPHIETILKQGYANNFEELVEFALNNEIKTEFIHEDAYANVEKNSVNKLESKKSFDRIQWTLAIASNVITSMVENNIELTPENYEEHRKVYSQEKGKGSGNINNRNFPKLGTIENELPFEELIEEFNKTYLYVTKVEPIKVKQEPMYDFTVDEHENMFIVTSQDGNKTNMICVHNSSIYDAMVRLARGNESLLHPYVDSKGNFGKVYSKDSAAASRYTEAKLEKIMEEFFRDIDSNAVQFVDNYDSTTKEPLLLPVTFPSILANPNMGIAVGMASNICSFNLEELCNATIAIMQESMSKKNPEVTTELLMEILKAPDFPTGGLLIYNKETIKQIYETGRGSIYLRAKYKYNEKRNCIEVYEVPYTTTVEAIVDSVIELVKNNQVKELVDIRDDSDKDGLQVTLDLKKNVDPEQLMARLFKVTPLESSFSANFNIIHEGRPYTLGIKDILTRWIEFRVDCVRKQLVNDLEKNKKKLNMLRGLEKVLLDIDKVIKIVRGTTKEKEVIANLMKNFDLDEEQATFIAEIKLRNLNKEYILNRTKDISETEKVIKNLEKDIDSDVRIKNIMIKDLERVIIEHGQPRKTQVISESKVKIANEEELFVDDYNVKIFLTKEGYIKKVPLTSMRGAGDHKLKDGDIVVQEIDSANKSDIIFFTNKQVVYKIKTHELEDSKVSQFGEYIPNILKLSPGEEVISVINTLDYAGSLIFLFENGKCARVSLKGYETKQNRKQLINAYSKASNLIRMYYVPEGEDIDIALISSINKALIFNTSKVNVNNTKTSQGVGIMKGAKSDKDFKVTRVADIEELKLEDPEYYRANGTVAAVGKFLKKEDSIE